MRALYRWTTTTHTITVALYTNRATYHEIELRTGMEINVDLSRNEGVALIGRATSSGWDVQHV